jgi:hypothetical protein
VRKACVAALVLTACGVELPVPTDLARIDVLRKGHLAKQGVPIDGWNCGERYALAVTGVSEAVNDFARCREDLVVAAVSGAAFYGSMMAGVALAGDRDLRPELGVAVGAAIASIALSTVAGLLAGHHRNHAVEVYNAAVERAKDARRPKLPDE